MVELSEVTVATPQLAQADQFSGFFRGFLPILRHGASAGCSPTKIV
jgi:hypothetical protein